MQVGKSVANGNLKEDFNMIGNLKLDHPYDLELISLVEAWEIRYWKDKFGVTGEQLVEAVKAVGIQAEDVRRHLASQSGRADSKGSSADPTSGAA
jgi:hypothetical protein